jgi:hypothetical protein
VDFTESRRGIIRDAFADEAGVTKDKVTVSVLAGSVVIEVSIRFNNSAEAATAQAAIETSMGDAEAASTFLSAASVQVVSKPAVVQTTKLVVETEAPTDDSTDPDLQIGGDSSALNQGDSPEASDSTAIIIIVAVVAVVGLLVVAAVIYVVARKSQQGKSPQFLQATPAGINMVSTTSKSAGPRAIGDEVTDIEFGSPRAPLSPVPGSPIPGSPKRPGSPVPGSSAAETSTAARLPDPVVAGAIAKMELDEGESKI